MNFKIESISGGDKAHAGQIIRYKVSVLPGIRVRWVTELTNVNEPHSFTDEQRSGPFAVWRHLHTFQQTPTGVEMNDVVDYAPPLGFIGRMANHLFVEREVKAIFDYRAEVLSQLFTARK